MPWLKVDDQLPSHPKSTALEIACGAWEVYCAATLLWRDLGCDCSHNLTEGRFTRTRALNVLPRSIPVDVIDRALAALVASGFIDADTAPHSYVFHDWNDYNPTRDEVLEKRRATSEKRAAAGSKGGNTTSANRKDGKYGGNRAAKGVATEQQHDSKETSNDTSNGAPPVPSPGPNPISDPKSEPPPTPPQQTEAIPPVQPPKPDPVVVVAQSPSAEPADDAPRPARKPLPAGVVEKGERLLAIMEANSGSNFDPNRGDTRKKLDLMSRLATYAIGDALAAEIGRLCAVPKKVWPWARDGAFDCGVSVSFLVGSATADGFNGDAFGQVVTLARKNLAAAAEKATRAAAPPAAPARPLRPENIPGTPEYIAANERTRINAQSRIKAAVAAEESASAPASAVIQ
jgi:hypothetical protein